jgi:uncharacterized protein (DUF58 family)
MLHRPRDRTVHPLYALWGIAFHGGMMFVIPFLVGGIASAFLEVSQVVETVGTLGTITLVLMAPLFVAQVVGVFLKTWRELGFLRRQQALGLRTVLDAVYRNTRILTTRGYFVFFSGLVFVLLSLAFKWAELGVIAVASLLMFYIVTGASVFLSSFLVRVFEAGLGRGQAGIRREFHPAVARCGDVVEEQFQLRKVPILPGYFLAIDDELPDRLQTLVRHVVPPKAGRGTVTVSSSVRATPRGTYEVGPARIWYQDLLGMTQISVASLATAKLKVLPQIRPLEIIEPPRSPLQEPDILTRPHRFPTEDYFRFREYHPGDDTRRLHWRLSMRVGQLQVRLPEARETSVNKVVLALDTFVPKEWLSRVDVIDDLLDGLVDVWVSMADELLKRGEHVTLVAALPDAQGNVTRQAIACGSNNRAAWIDAGARAMWQSELEVFKLFDPEDTPQEAFMVVLTSRLAAVPPDPLPGRRTTWIYLHPRDTLGPPPPDTWTLWLDWQDRGAVGELDKLRRFVQLPHPASSDENALVRRWKHWRKRKAKRDRRVWIYEQVRRGGDVAFGSLLSRPDVVYRMEVLGDRYRLVGVSAGAGGAAAGDASRSREAGQRLERHSAGR